MKNQTLKDFYLGNLSPAIRQMVKGSDIARAVEDLAEAGNILERNLPPELLPALKRFMAAQTELDRLTAEAYYLDGFKTGARLMMDVLDDGHENLEPVRD